MSELPKYKGSHFPSFMSRSAGELLYPIEYVHPTAQMEFACGRCPQHWITVDQFIHQIRVRIAFQGASDGHAQSVVRVIILTVKHIDSIPSP